MRRCKSYACYLADGSLAAESLALDRGLFGLPHPFDEEVLTVVLGWLKQHLASNSG